MLEELNYIHPESHPTPADLAAPEILPAKPGSANEEIDALKARLKALEDIKAGNAESKNPVITESTVSQPVPDILTVDPNAKKLDEFLQNTGAVMAEADPDETPMNTKLSPHDAIEHTFRNAPQQQ